MTKKRWTPFFSQSENGVPMGSSLFETLFHSAGDAFFVADAETGMIVDVNRRAEDLTGHSRSELLAMHQHELHPPEMREYYEHLFQKHAEGDRKVFPNVQVLRKGGGVVHVEVMGSVHKVDGRHLVFGVFRDTSDRDITLRRLEQSDRRNRAIAEFAPIGILVHCDRRIVFANHTAQDILGETDMQSFLGRDVLDIVHPDDRAGVVERMGKVLNSREYVPPLEEKLLKGDGSAITVEVSATPIDWDGRVSVMVAFRDISDRVRQRQYRESLVHLLQNVLYRFETPALLDETTRILTERFGADAVCITLREGNTLRVRSATGVGLKLREKLDQSPIEEDSTPCARTVLFETPLIIEDLSLTKFRGEVMSLFNEVGLRSCWSTPLQDQEKKTIGAISAYFSQTQLPSEEEMSLLQHASYLASMFIEKGELLDENDRLSLVARQTREGVVLTDTQHRVVWVNRGFERLTGFTLEEVRGKNLRPILQGPATSPSTTALMKERLASRQGFDCRVFNYRKNGETFWNALRIDPMYDRNGVLIGFIGLQSDASEEVGREERLEQALAQTEEALRARSEFLSVVSHEIRTPLNSLMGIVHLLLDRDPRPDQKEDLVVLRDSASRLHTLISNLLDYGRIETGRFPLEKSPFSLAELVEDLRQAFSGAFASRGLTFRVELDPTIPDLLIGDRIRLRQVIQNLISNALKFTTEGGAEVRFTNVGVENGKAEIEVVVTDTGEGIPLTETTRIFEPFYQADSSLTRRHGGTGLGLAIAEKILELYGSHIEVSSQMGKGSVFWFRIQLDRSTGKAPAPIVHDLAQLNGFRILIVEDYEANTLITRKFLELWNIQVDQARNGEEAVYKAKHGGYDLILMDLHMPVMDGYEATRRIREFDNKIPIVALTASDQKEIPERIREAGMNDLIVKPFHPAELNRKLRQLLQR